MLIILRLDAPNKASSMSEGVAEIRINSQPCKGINLTTRHTQAQRAPRVTTIHDAVKKMIRAQLTLVHVFHTYALADTPWVAHALFYCTHVRYGRIASSQWHMMLLSLGIPYVPYVSVHFKCLFIRTQPTHALIDTDRGYHFGAPNIRLDHSRSFSSNILHFPLIARPVSNYANHSIILLNHIRPPSIEMALSRADSNHSSSTDSLHD
jgi:hypothetical protein